MSESRTTENDARPQGEYEQVEVLAREILEQAREALAMVEAVSAANSAPIMARLHELKRTRFPATARDYDL